MSLGGREGELLPSLDPVPDSVPLPLSPPQHPLGVLLFDICLMKPQWPPLKGLAGWSSGDGGDRQGTLAGILDEKWYRCQEGGMEGS